MCVCVWDGGVGEVGVLVAAGRGGGGEYNFRGGLILGGINFENAQKPQDYN